MKKTKWLGLLILFFLKTSFAEEIELGKIVITPYRTKISLATQPSSVEVIDTEEALEKGKLSLKEALKSIPSLNYASSSDMGESSIFIRGAEARHTQILLEGIKLYDPASTSGYFYAYNYLNLFPFEKVEVAKGPYSVLYGSDSIGGTINLITKKGEGKPSFSYFQEIGSYHTYKEAFSFQGEIDKLSYFLSLTKTDINSFYAQKYKNGNHEKDPLHNFNSFTRLDYNLNSDTALSLFTHYIYSKYEYDSSTGDDDNNIAHFYQGVSGIKLENKISKNFSQQLLLGFTRTYRKHWEDSSTNYWYNGKTYQIKYKLECNPIYFYKVLVGFDYLREKAEGIYASAWGIYLSPPKSTANTKGYYIENIFKLLNNLFFSFSFRLEDHSNFGKENLFSLQGAYIIKKTNTKLKASWAEGFKAPSLYQLYSSYGDPTLSAEKSESYETGIEQSLFNNLKLSIVYFHTHLSNLIDFNSPTGKYYNAGKSKIEGIETNLEYNITDTLRLKFSYTNMDTEKKEDGSRLLRRPKNKVDLELEIFKGKFRISPQITYVGNRIDSGSIKLKSYLLVNLSLNFELKENLNFFLRIENILDKDYELISGYQTKKISFYTGFKMKF
jgi:vitamin B12 transporter